VTGTPPLPWLAPDASPEDLPDPSLALEEPNGLLAVGGALTSDWLLTAYRRGVFPWFSRGQPVLWWSPDPRAVIVPDRFRVSRSLARSIRNRGYETRIDTDFAAVLDGCAGPRPEGEGTWIVPAMRRAYQDLHRLGWAHSFETWHDGRLVGGLYGVWIGRLFCGESMFTRARDASKVALARLVDEARAGGIALIDCQMPTPHLDSLGAVCIPRVEYLRAVASLTVA
jgi:leucyl/phenylalanyl-tRNA--protein transferase